MDTTKPQTLESWRQFMNGYRDPVTNAENKRLRDKWEDGEDEDYFSDYREMSSGGDGERECGHRKEGGTYAVVPTSANGTPVDDFLLCKPLPIDKDEYNLSNVGVRLIDIPQTCVKCGGVETKGAKTCQTCYGTGKETITHVFDIIGQEYYPNVADFMEEARRMGISRRLELEDAKQYARLSSRSRLFFLHGKAIIKNPVALYKKMGETEAGRLRRAGCPKKLFSHPLDISQDSGCSALYWNVLEGGEEIPETHTAEHYLADLEGGAFKDLNRTLSPTVSNRFVERKLASGTYRGYALPEDVKANYALGVFAVFPLGKIEVVDPSGEYEDRVDRASAARLDVEAVEC